MTVLKAKDDTIRKYYKYQTQSWSQPTLVNNGGVVDNFSALNYYHAFLPNTTYLTIYRNENRGWVEVYMYSPTGLIPKSFSFYVQNRTDASSKAYNTAFYGTNEDWVMHTPIPSGCNNSTRNGINTGDWAAAWTNLGTAGTVNENTTGTINMSTNTQHYKWLRFECSTYGTAYNDRLTIKNLQLTADQRIVTNGTSSNYDFYQDIPYKKLIMEDNGTKPSSNYTMINTLRPGVVTDTITYKEDTNYIYKSNSSSGSIYNGKTGYSTINTAKAFNPTLGEKLVRPISATFTSTTVSSQWTSNCKIYAYYSSSDSGTWGAARTSSSFNGATKGSYNVTWSSSTPFGKWWTFTPYGAGWQSGTQTLAGTLSNVVWEVENTGSTVPDKRYYVIT